jgi:4-alpha-glucanotransferase
MTNLFPRESGVLMHFTSLPAPHGIGDLGPNAYHFANFLESAGQRIWQVLPTGPVGYGDSPYQCYSAFAGNPLMISLELLAQGGLLRSDEIGPVPGSDPSRMDSAAVKGFKRPLIERAAERMPETEEYRIWIREQAHWLDDYALYMALKERYDGAAWLEFPESLRLRHPGAMDEARHQLHSRIEILKRIEYLFDAQFDRLKKYCNSKRIRLMGDIPIYVALDSADVWSNPAMFDLDEANQPVSVAGTPPDYFSATGQRWGNPVYRWERHRSDGFAWWIRRLEGLFQNFDLVRLDHFRGFEAYWAIPAEDPTAVNGEWRPAPGREFFQTCQRHFGQLPIVAENLGDITPEVEALREEFGFPGMSVLLFAWGDGKANQFQPHRFERETVAYTGTHDNDTVMGWWHREGEQADRERTYAARYLRMREGPHRLFVETLMASVANTAIVPLQDVLGLGNEARMNLPGVANGNWSWRLREDQILGEHVRMLRDAAELYERI